MVEQLTAGHQSEAKQSAGPGFDSLPALFVSPLNEDAEFFFSFFFLSLFFPVSPPIPCLSRGPNDRRQEEVPGSMGVVPRALGVPEGGGGPGRGARARGAGAPGRRGPGRGCAGAGGGGGRSGSGPETAEEGQGGYLRRRGLLLAGAGAAGAAAPCACLACLRGAFPPLYDAYAAAVLSAPAGAYEASVASAKAMLFERLGAALHLLDVGVGAAPNAALYPAGAAVLGVDSNSSMAARARSSAAEAGSREFRFRTGAADALPVADESFDAVCMTLVLCSVSDQAAAIAEAARALRTGGQLVVLEHQIAPSGTTLAAAQRVLGPAQALVAGGCDPARHTGAALLAAAGVAGSDGTAWGRRAPVFDRVDVYEEFMAEGAGLISPHVAAVLVK